MMFTEHLNLNPRNCKPDNSTVNNIPTGKCCNGLIKACNRYDLKKVSTNFEDAKMPVVQKQQTQNSEINVNISPPLNIMPPPPHKIVNKDNVTPFSYNRKGYWKSNYINGRSLSPLGYDSDESSKSYGSKGNVAEEHGKHCLCCVC